MSHAINRAINLIVAAALMVLVTSVDRSLAAGPDVSDFKLGNGLEVVVIPDHRTPVVTHMVWYKVGAADETPGKSGLAHFLEHLMFKGTKKNPQGLFSRTVSNIGGSENAFTTSDYTAFFQRVPRQFLKLMMQFEADRMTGLALTEDVVKPELQVVLEEYNMRIANNPGARLSEQIDAALYLNHPYGRPVIGWHQEIEKLTSDDAIAFYRRFYTPNNAILIVAGDVTAAEVKKFAEETYGKVPVVAKVAPRVRPQEPVPEASRTVTLADARVAQPSLQRYYLVPSYTSGRPGEGEALEVLAHILGGGSNGRLYQALAVQKGIATSAGAGYDGTALDPTHLYLYGTPKPGTTLAQLESAMNGVLADFIKNGVTKEELERSKNRLLADAIYAQDNQSTLARWYGSSLATGQTVEQVKTWPDRIRAVTADDVRNAARKWIDIRRSVTGYLVKSAKSTDGRS